MTKTYQISIPKFMDKQKKLDGKRQFIRLDNDVFFDSKVDALKPLEKLLYLFVLTRLDENGDTLLTEKQIRNCLGLSRNVRLDCMFDALLLHNLCIFVAQKDNKKTPNQHETSKNKPTIYKDVLKESREEKSKVNKENRIGCLEKTEKTFNQDKAFEEIWEQYPCKDGKKPAKKHFLATVLTEDDYSRIQKSLNNYLNSSKVKNGYIKNGSTWFNQWGDFEHWTEPITNKTMADHYGTSELTIKNLKVLEEVFGDKRRSNKNGTGEDGRYLQQTINQDDYYDVPGSFTGIE